MHMTTVSKKLATFTDDNYRELYGKNTYIYHYPYECDEGESTIVLVMPGSWTQEKADLTFERFDPDENLEPDCPICRAIMRLGGTFVF